MGIESFDVGEDADYRQSSKGFYVSKAQCTLVTIVILLAFTGLALGLVFGLKKPYSENCTSSSSSASTLLQQCTETGCKNLTFIQELNNQCFTTTRPTVTLQSGTGGQVVTTPKPPVIDYRLPKSLKPFFYHIITMTDFDVHTQPEEFHGYVTISVLCTERTNRVVLHQSDLDIDRNAIKVERLSNNAQINVVGTATDDEREFYIINLATDLESGQRYSISMNYTGALESNNMGFYRSVYEDSEGNDRWLMTSQMEPTDARRAFPCFDEPALKAEFKMTVVHHKSLHAMSNMPINNTEEYEDDLMKTEFEVTVSMSTYLVALILSDFECKTETIENMGAEGSVDVRVCGRADEVAKGRLDYALEVSKKIIKFYEEYYGVEYPLPKCDHVAIPDFAAGAMENWGLITYRESVLFYNEATSSANSKQLVVIYIAHELAHMWFGNLVSPAWWNDLWLNEGFATYVEYVGTDFAEKSFLMFEQYVEEVFDILKIDSVANSHAISVEVNKPDEINEIFDDISYGKGGSLIRMMNYMLGDKTFAKGIRNYLNKYAFSNAIQDNLWDELDAAAKNDSKLKDVDLKTIMNTWTRQMGHPLITVQRVDDSNIRISQKHFLIDPTSTPAETSQYNYSWYVPFTHSVETLGAMNAETFGVSMENLNERIEWLKQNEESKTIKLAKPLSADNFILANLDVSGFYRVNYDEPNWMKIIQQLNNKNDAIPPRSRAQIINDAFELSQGEVVPTTRPFEIIRYLSKETEYLPWSTTIAGLRYYTDLLDSTSAFANYKNYVLDLITPLYNRFGWVQQESDNWLDGRLRTSVLTFACARELDDCVKQSVTWYSQWMQNEKNNQIPASYRTLVYCTAIRNGGDKEWDFASRQYDNEQDAAERSYLQRGMSCARQPWLISKFLNDQINPDKVRLQDAVSGLSAAAFNSYANARTWSFVKENWDFLISKLSLSGLITAIASKFNTQAQLNDFQTFFAATPNQGSVVREIRTSIDKIKANIRWMKISYSELNEWLEENAPSTTTQVNYRLPTNLVPFEYEVLIKPQFEITVGKGFPYDGQVNIRFTCVSNTSNLVFHVNKLDIDNSTVSVKSSSDLDFGEIKGFAWKNDFVRQFFVAELPKQLKANHNYSVSMKFTGSLTDDNAGFYRSSYKIGNETRWLLASQMEPTDARKSFPCFDEPALKAVFKMSVIHHEDYKAISNMPVETISPAGDELLRTNFAPTPPMSSYLVGLVVSDFECIDGVATEAGPEGNLPISVCARSNALDQLEYAMDVAIESIEFFEKRFGLKYPLPKCDHIALPDFSAGAMENWGIITYREARLLYTAGVTSQSAETGIATVIVHEVAHMWFGDIVSPQWWNDLWLNEGFARYMQYVGTDPIKPEWEMYEQIVSLLLDIQQLDSVASSHAVSVEVNNPDEINELFDDITYGKGGSIIRMAEYFLGTDTFYRGINRYLNQYAYGNAIEDYLWDTLGEIAQNESKLEGLHMGDIMNTWTRQMGHPVITVKKLSVEKKVSLTQEHFLLDPYATPEPSKFGYKWYVPFTHTVETIGQSNNDAAAITQNTLWDKVLWLLPNETTKIVELANPIGDNQFILGNTRVSGFYRVNYDDENWDKIIKQLLTKKDAIPIRNRAQLINDAMSFSQSGLLDATRQFEIVKYLPEETEYLPWITAINRFRYLNDMLESTSAYGKLQTYLSGLIQPIYSKLGWTQKPSDSWLQRLLRTSVLSFACARGIPDCVNQAKSYYSTWMSQETNNPIPASYRAFVYCTAIREGGEKEWNFASEQYMKQTDSNQKSDLQSGMSCTRIPWLINRFLNDQLDTSKVRVQDSLSGLRAAATKAEANCKTWNFVKENWKELFSRYGKGLSFARLFTDLTSKFNTQAQLDDYDQFFQQNPNQGSATREIKISRDRVKSNINWLSRTYTHINTWLIDNVEPTQITNINYRLPTNFQPIQYDILVKPQFEDEVNNSFAYDGEVTIRFTCVNETSTLVFHINNLNIDNSSLLLKGVTDQAFGEVKAFSWKNDYTRQFFVAELPKSLKKNNVYSVFVKFTGFMKDDNAGFYRSSYRDENGEKRWLMTSQMQPTDARKSFPCFDEPAMKAVFKISVIHRKDYSAISNMPSTSITAVQGSTELVRTDFQPTPQMSSYLVGLVVSDFKCIDGIAAQAGVNGNLPIRICARSSALNQLDYALDVAIKIIEYFEKLYAIKYPLPKCDHIALPDFSAGAMENWGIVTYRESRLLYTAGVTSQSAEQSIATVIVHEIAHMWFGDIVSPAWWNDLWLNEGFANFMEHVGTDHVKPDWGMYEQLTNSFLSVQQVDSVASSHEIAVEVNNPDEINEIFDDITYQKGGSVVRMANYFIGSDTFYRGITKYLNKYVYSTAVQDNLWSVLEEVAKNESRLLDVDLIKVMSTWTRQMGHPVVTIAVDGKEVSLSQNHFLLDPSSAPPASPYNYKWYIPFTHSIEKVGETNDKTFELNTNNLWERVMWLLPNETEHTVTLAQPLGDDDFILANLEVSGFYRVNYDPENWDKIARQLQKKKDAIPTRSRAQLIHDAFSFSQANLIETTKPFEIIKYMSEETEYLPWNLAISRLGYITNMLESTSAFGSYQTYLINLIKPLYNKLGWEEKPTDTWLQKLLRTTVLSFACNRGVPDCVNKARSYYSTWMLNENNNPIPPSYRSLVYCTAIREGGEKEWNFASARYSKETDANLKNSLQSGMSCTRYSYLITKFLNDQIDSQKVRVQDALNGIRAAAVRIDSNLRTWNFVKANWDLLFSRYGNGLGFARLIADITSKFNSQLLLDDYNAFFEAHPNQGSSSREVKISRDKVKANINWINNNLKTLTEWLNNNVGEQGGEEKPKDVRLPTDLKPTLYDLTITPYIGTTYGDRSFTFDGTMEIHFTCTTPTKQIIFHIKDLVIKDETLKVTSKDDADLNLLLPWTNDVAREFFKANFNRECKQGSEYVIHIDYTGPISKSLYGFYRSSYTDKDGKTAYLATTDFEPTDARRAFPCFDEPAMKAKFRLTIFRNKDFTTSFGNMPHEFFDVAVPGNPDLRKDTFKESVPMSTYLVAFVVANYRVREKLSPVKEIKVEIAARPAAIEDGEGDFALEEAADIIDFFADYFDTPYPLEKSTQIAIPDFNSGAMENWGLITYREPSLLYNPQRDTVGNKRRVSQVVSHELAHQWFGNLVTPEWWNDLWLNEGFASWVEYLGYNSTHPEWRDLDSFFTQRLSVLVKDSLESSHPINVQVDNPDDINGLFDSISYDKGASIIRMMNSFLTEKTFRGGVSKYLKKFEFANANQDDLWQSLTDQAYLDNTLSRPLSVKTIMDTWTLQKGYPVVTLDRDYVNKKVKISQKWFLLNPEKQSIESTQEWFVPFTHTTQKNPVSSFIFEATPIWHKPKDGEVVVDLNADANEWLVGNLHHSGFYRVNYDKKNWDMLIAQLNSDHTRIHEINRATLIDDSFNLGRAEKLEQKVFLDIVKYLQNEQDPIPWTAAFSGMGYFSSQLSSTTTGTFTAYKKLYKNLLRQTYGTYGWDETLDVTLVDLQLQSMSILCLYEEDDCVQKAKDYFKEWRENNIELPPNFKTVIYQTAIKFGSEDDWYFLFNKAKETTSNAEQVRMFRALASTREYYLLKFLLSQTLVPTVIKPQDETSIISAVNSNIAGRELAWNHFVANWDGLFNRYGSLSFTLGSLVSNLVSSLNTEADLQKVLNFMQLNPDQGTAAAAFKEGVETISTNIRWMKTNFASIAQFLEEETRNF